MSWFLLQDAVATESPAAGKSVCPPASQRAQDLETVGHQERSQEHYEAALACFEDWYRVAPNDKMALYWQAAMSMPLRRYEHANIKFTEFVKEYDIRKWQTHLCAQVQNAFDDIRRLGKVRVDDDIYAFVDDCKMGWGLRKLGFGFLGLGSGMLALSAIGFGVAFRTHDEVCGGSSTCLEPEVDDSALQRYNAFRITYIVGLAVGVPSFLTGLGLLLGAKARRRKARGELSLLLGPHGPQLWGRF